MSIESIARQRLTNSKSVQQIKQLHKDYLKDLEGVEQSMDASFEDYID